MAAIDRLSAYRIYLLTVWRESGCDRADRPVWRFRLEDPRTGERRGFTCAEALLAALQVAFERSTAASGEEELHEQKCNRTSKR